MNSIQESALNQVTTVAMLVLGALMTMATFVSLIP
jgi:hypothetical protein